MISLIMVGVGLVLKLGVTWVSSMLKKDPLHGWLKISLMPAVILISFHLKVRQILVISFYVDFSFIGQYFEIAIFPDGMPDGAVRLLLTELRIWSTDRSIFSLYQNSKA